jgi:hypothetical protein
MRERKGEKGIKKWGSSLIEYTFRQFEIKTHRTICLLKKLTSVTVYTP